MAEWGDFLFVHVHLLFVFATFMSSWHVPIVEAELLVKQINLHKPVENLCQKSHPLFCRLFHTCRFLSYLIVSYFSLQVFECWWMLEKSCTFPGVNHPTSSMEMPWWHLTLGQLWPKVTAWWIIKFSNFICHPFGPCGLMRAFRQPMTDVESSNWWVRLWANIGICCVYRRALTVTYKALSYSPAAAYHTQRDTEKLMKAGFLSTIIPLSHHSLRYPLANLHN